MTKKETLAKTITIWWWNMGHKQKDFEGTYGEWFKKNKISIKESKKNCTFNGSFGSMTFSIKLSKDYMHNFNLIIKLCLTFLGDKAMS